MSVTPSGVYVSVSVEHAGALYAMVVRLLALHRERALLELPGVYWLRAGVSLVNGCEDFDLMQSFPGYAYEVRRVNVFLDLARQLESSNAGPGLTVRVVPGMPSAVLTKGLRAWLAECGPRNAFRDLAHEVTSLIENAVALDMVRNPQVVDAS